MEKYAVAGLMLLIRIQHHGLPAFPTSLLPIRCAKSPICVGLVVV